MIFHYEMGDNYIEIQKKQTNAQVGSTFIMAKVISQHYYGQ
jgi:hypothetical protein